MNSITHQILNISDRAVVDFPSEESLGDALNFGFSFVESEDNMVAYVLVSPAMALRILREVKESTLNPNGEILGGLWTSNLIVSSKIRDNRIIFANHSLTVVLIMDLSIGIKTHAVV